MDYPILSLTSDKLAQVEAVATRDINNVWWRLNNLYRIMDERGQEVQFQLNDAQRQLYGDLWYLNVILKARQLGFTTFIQLFILDRCLFNSNVRAGVIAHNREDAQTFFRDKIKFAYDHLPSDVKEYVPAIKNDAGELLLANNSSIRVGVSMRSGTLQYLHVSEFGKIARKYPEKAQEIVTGSLNAVHPGSFVFIESTAEGAYGHFYDMAQAAKAIKLADKPLTKMDYKFHFFPWWQDKRYRLPVDGVVMGKADREYFSRLEERHGIKLDDEQKAWYVKKAVEQGDKIKQEYPSTPDEAFEQAIEGAYYASQMAKVRKDGRITHVPFDPRLPVHTAWDLGVSDHTTIWFIQVYGNQYRLIDFESYHGEGLQHYVNILHQKGFVYGKHYLPHDVEVQELGTGVTRREVLESLGLSVEVVPRVKDKADAIQSVRDVLPMCWFDEEHCSEGIKCLDSYRKEWDDKLGAFKPRPLHDWASHGNDAFEQFARGMVGLNISSGISSGHKRRSRNARIV